MSMKIVAGLGSVDEYIPFVNAGADEFFCGYVPYAWTEKYGTLSPLNRREVRYYNVQLGSESELMILRKMIESYKAPVHLTFNSLYYLPEQYPIVAGIIKRCMSHGFESFIIADPALVLYLRQQKINCRIHLSGETAEVNRNMLDFFRQFDLERIIFHRKNTIGDMNSCISHIRKKEAESCSGTSRKHMEFEAFILNELCHYTGAFCNSLHCDELPHLCLVPYWMTGKEDSAADEEEEFAKEQEAEYLTGAGGCGLCALYQIQKAGVTHLKLVGRGNYIEYARRDIAQLKLALRILEKAPDEKSFQKEMKAQIFCDSCSRNCYYL